MLANLITRKSDTYQKKEDRSWLLPGTVSFLLTMMIY